LRVGKNNDAVAYANNVYPLRQALQDIAVESQFLLGFLAFGDVEHETAPDH
jgi:hypothetical protein